MGKHKVVVGLGFGDEGKGTIVDFLTSEEHYDFVVRFSGGPQAAHNVITADGTHHTFSQFGSGFFNGAGTILSKYMLVDPLRMASEAEALHEKTGSDPFANTLISESSLLILPWHAGINRLEEIRRGENRHGSCGVGVGVAQKFAIDYPELAFRMSDLYLDRNSFIAKAWMVRSLLDSEYGTPTIAERAKLGNNHPGEVHRRSSGNLFDMLQFFVKDHSPLVVSDEEIQELIGSSSCVFEGSQGALLDEWKGFHPYTTWSTTTSQNALQLLTAAGVDVDANDVEVIGVSRTYHTRHGAGPFPTEDSCLLERFPEPHNGTGIYQGGWRVGAFDTALFKYAIDINPRIDSLAFTHLDFDYVPLNNAGNFFLSGLAGTLKDQEKITKELLDSNYEDFLMYIRSEEVPVLAHQVAQKPISILSYGPRTDEKRLI